MKSCISCGMPMGTAAQFAGGDVGKDYCCHCARPDGTMKSYDEALAGMTAFMVRTQGVDEGAARKAVRDMMSRLPAWSGTTKAE